MKIRPRRAQNELAIEDYLPQFTKEGHHRFSATNWGDDPEHHLLDQEGREALEKAISALPADYQVPLLLRDAEGLSNAEAAEVLRATVPAVKARLHRARLVLRGMLANYFREREARPAPPDPRRKDKILL